MGVGLDVGSKVGVAVGRGGVLVVVFGEVEVVVIAVATGVETGRNKQVLKQRRLATARTGATNPSTSAPAVRR